MKIRNIQKMNSLNADIVVIGGGISGTLAAVAAARTGQQVLLAERYGFLGGMLTAGGVGPMMTFHAGDRQVVRGLNGELIERLQRHHASPGHLVDTTGYTFSVTPFDAEAMKLELDRMCREAAVRVLFHSQLTGCVMEDGVVTAVRLQSGVHQLEVRARVFVDATGNADLAVLAGAPTVKGRPEDGRCQPMTMNLKVYNVDIPAVRAYIHAHPEEFPRLKGDTSIIDRAPRLSIGGFVETLRQAREAGEITFPREDVLFFETANPGEVIVNTSRIVDLDPTDPFALSQAEMAGREQVDQLMAFLRKRVAGFSAARLAFSGPQVGIRSSRQLRGAYVLRAEDVLGAIKFPDAVACNAYPIDIHSPTGNPAESRHGHLHPGEYYTIPYRSLYALEVKNLLVTGRAISGEFAAQAAFRTTPCAGALGHAAGAAAALAAKRDGNVTTLPYPELRNLLLQQAAFLPDQV